MGKEGVPQPDKLRLLEQLEEDVKIAMSNESYIMGEIDRFLKTTPNSVEDRIMAKDIVLRQHAPHLKSARKRTEDAIDTWLEELRKYSLEQTRKFALGKLSEAEDLKKVN